MNAQFWKDKLAPLVERDMFIRDALLQRGVLSDAYHKEMEKVHIENARKLKAFIDTHGFPVLSSAGEASVKLAWLIIHHAISLPDFMQDCVIEMRLAGAQKDFPLDLLAYTEDRIRFFEGRPQLYGTNSDWQNGELKPTPIEDIAQVNLRRKSMGLGPLETFTTSSMERPPKDPTAKQQEFEAWLKRTGWRS
jgi:hypothetical protein